jgi:hypothetical protein
MNNNDLKLCAYILHIINDIGAAGTLEKIEVSVPWNMPQDIAQK